MLFTTLIFTKPTDIIILFLYKISRILFFQMQIREEEFEDDLLKIKQQMNQGQRLIIIFNIAIKVN